MHANNIGTDQTAHLCSLVSAFVVSFLDRIMARLAANKLSILQLGSVADLTG